MATKQLAAAPARRDGRNGGALDTQTEQEIAALNDLAVAALLERVAAAAAAGALPPAARAGRGSTRLSRPERAARGVGLAAVAGSASRPAPGAAAGEGSAAGPGAVAGAAAASSPAGEAAALQSLPPALRQLGHAWLELEEPARRFLVATPYLLLEIDFDVLLPGIAAGTREPAAGRLRVAPTTVDGVGDAGVRTWRDVARLAFQYAWHLAQSAPTLAAFAIGTRHAAVQALRGLDVVRADALALAAGPHVALRWADDAPFWAEWLAAARSADANALWACRRRGLQRIAGECRAPLSP